MALNSIFQGGPPAGKTFLTVNRNEF